MLSYLNRSSGQMHKGLFSIAACHKLASPSERTKASQTFMNLLAQAQTLTQVCMPEQQQTLCRFDQKSGRNSHHGLHAPVQRMIAVAKAATSAAKAPSEVASRQCLPQTRHSNSFGMASKLRKHGQSCRLVNSTRSVCHTQLAFLGYAGCSCNSSKPYSTKGSAPYKGSAYRK